MSKSKLMSVEKQMKLKVGDIVVLNGINRPGVVTEVDLHGHQLPVQVEFFYNDDEISKTLWSHPPIIRRYPRVGEKVILKNNSGGNIAGNHNFATPIQVTVTSIHNDNRFIGVSSGESSQVVWEKDVKRIKGSKVQPA